MKKIVIYILLSFVLVPYSFGQDLNYGKPVVAPKAILRNFNSFWNYLNVDVQILGDFIALDTASNVITKEAFLRSLTSGKYLPLLLRSKDSPAYKLFTLNATVDGADIKDALRNWADVEYSHYKMEGEKLPEFNFVDLEGKVYNKETTKGKILVLKCWFIRCQPCIEEMPDLNKLVRKYKKRDDILFVSLALDPKDDLDIFMKKIHFRYAVIPDQKKYIMDDLQIHSFPTHLIINKQGLISRVVKNYSDLAVMLDKEAEK